MLCNAAADLMDTAGMHQHGKVRDFGPSGIARLMGSLMRNRYILGGIVANAVGFFTTMSLLSLATVSFAIPASAGGFVLETALAKIILKEDVHWQRWVGATVVACGVALLALP